LQLGTPKHQVRKSSLTVLCRRSLDRDEQMGNGPFQEVREARWSIAGGPKAYQTWRGNAAARAKHGPCLAWHLRVKGEVARAFSRARFVNGQKPIPPRDQQIGSRKTTEDGAFELLCRAFVPTQSTSGLCDSPNCSEHIASVESNQPAALPAPPALP
jgi:hypothetical protein